MRQSQRREKERNIRRKDRCAVSRVLGHAVNNCMTVIYYTGWGAIVYYQELRNRIHDRFVGAQVSANFICVKQHDMAGALGRRNGGKYGNFYRSRSSDRYPDA